IGVAIAYRPAEHEFVADAVVGAGEHAEAAVIVGVLQRGLVHVAPGISEIDEAAPAAAQPIVLARGAASVARQDARWGTTIGGLLRFLAIHADDQASRAAAQIQQPRAHQTHFRCFHADLLLSIRLYRSDGLDATLQLIVADFQ